jgi:hypothetical protein
MKSTHARVEVGFGLGFDKNHQPITSSHFQLEAIKSKAVELFGGYTYYPSDGGWRHSDGELATEPGGTLLIFTDTPQLLPKANELCQFIKRVLNQEAVALGITEAQFTYV